MKDFTKFRHDAKMDPAPDADWVVGSTRYAPNSIFREMASSGKIPDDYIEALAYYCHKMKSLGKAKRHPGPFYGRVLRYYADTSHVTITLISKPVTAYTPTEVAIALAFEEYVAEHLSDMFVQLDTSFDSPNVLQGMDRVDLTIYPQHVTVDQVYDLLHTLYDLNTHRDGIGDWQEAIDIRSHLIEYAEMHALAETLATMEVRHLAAKDLLNTMRASFLTPLTNEIGWPVWPDWKVLRGIETHEGM